MMPTEGFVSARATICVMQSEKIKSSPETTLQYLLSAEIRRNDALWFPMMSRNAELSWTRIRLSLFAYSSAICNVLSVLQLLTIVYSQFEYVCDRTLSMHSAKCGSP